MNKKTLALFTTIYPEGKRFLNDFFSSLWDQSDLDFDTWVGLDRIQENEVKPYFGSNDRITYIERKSDESPSSLRQRAIKQIMKNYDAIIFVDSDDILEPNRVEAARNMLKICDVGGCALTIINEAGKPLGSIFQYPKESIIASKIPLCNNVFGLSNTIYTTNILEKILPIPDNCVLVDWFLATSAWIRGARFSFDIIPRMKYRQYGMNTARIIPPFTQEYILKAAEMALNHYLLVISSLSHIPSQHKTQLEEQEDKIRTFLSIMKQDQDKLLLYIQKLNELPSEHIWWDMVAHPHLDNIWKN
ncbi:glycosyltransferase family 2 protein [Methanospirillum lacunae]|uniref:Glycosyltransferase 2-like domain-containing protein n=1 Tax=Methanospirillum lacunae TaxID=668570 RepID=A0A2V2N5Z7_9EURY|nr:glycosyltransferase family 2 protein [Methanospirillum lacunae]PWR70713.1 hypothetical protein DK846_13970 [Methanospirillum lacunae]